MDERTEYRQANLAPVTGIAALRPVMTTRGVAWLDPADVKAVRRVLDNERAELKVPEGWGVALRVRIRGDEAWIVRGDPWPDALGGLASGEIEKAGHA